MKKVETVEEFDTLVDTEHRFFFVKHSSTCPISQAAFEEYEKFANDSEIPCFYLVVQEARPLSNFIAEKFQVKHESPQAILFQKADVAWHASHWKITEKTLNKASEAPE